MQVRILLGDRLGMRILWVKAGKLLPVDTGGKIRTYHLLRHLAARHAVTLLSYYGGRRDEAYEREIGRHLPGTVTLYTAAPDATAIERGLDYVRRLPSRAPYAVIKFTAPAVQRLLAIWFGERRFDLAVCDFLSASLNFPRVLATPSVLFQHNVETVLWRRQAGHEANLLKRIAFGLEAAKMRRYERAVVGRFHHVIAVSEPDREQMTRWTDPSRITVVPTGVDLEQYRAAARTGAPDATQPLVVFTGSMDWEANIDGVEYLCRDIWPRVRARAPGARLRIVGRNPHARVRKLAGDSIDVTGTVPSVIEHLRAAAVVVVPLRIGGGTRLKIFEAMAMGKAVVSTSVGAEGLDVRHGRDILLADDPASFADSVAALLGEPERRRRLETAAVERASQHDWSAVAGRLAEVLERVAGLAGAARERSAAVAGTSA
jgi:glycosyltransferase involved in cell wall biosynthesis